jgi:DNA modification methylase
MSTYHQIFYSNSTKMEEIENITIDIVVSSPPYPIIQIWDSMFSNFNMDIEKALETDDGDKAFELMHQELDHVWDEVFRVLKPGGIACINIGDALRTFNNNFKLYSNHTRILKKLLNLGFNVLPSIIWRKPTNAPNKFMGSGMLPPGAYVTLEHEYILILRKNGLRKFNHTKEKELRRESAYFWEERNLWFSDIWTGLKGISQTMERNNPDLRDRSAAYPFELAFRLINMFSVKGDVVLDPFLGTGTTTIAAMAAGRNSIGIEINSNFQEIIESRIKEIASISKRQIDQRIDTHISFVAKRTNENKEMKYLNEYYKFPVTTKQEVNLIFNEVNSFNEIAENQFEVTYKDKSPE